MPRGSAPRRSPRATRHSVTTCSARRSDAVTVPRFEIGARQGGGDRPADDVGRLGAARTVEVRGSLGEGGEVGTDRGDVVRHTGILPHPSPPGLPRLRLSDRRRHAVQRRVGGILTDKVGESGRAVTRRWSGGGPRRSLRCSGCRPSRARGTPPGCARRHTCSCSAGPRRSRRARPRRSGAPGRRTCVPS